MIEEQTWTKLVSLARQGRKSCMNLLAQEARGRLRAYIYRVTLDHDLTEDLSQEVLLQMVKSLDRLNEAERFWPWLYRIAQSKIQQHYKTKQRSTPSCESAFYQDFLSYRSDYHQDDGLRRLVQKELSKKVMAAMKQIKQQYRAVLSLRCFEQLSYSDIAMAMHCSEVRARVLFFRAKQALRKQLSHQGLSKGLLLMCLGVFGRLTAPAEAASSTVTVTAASTKVGLTAAVLATSSSKLGIATVAAAIVLGTVGGMSVLSESPLPPSSVSGRTDVQSLHYVTQLRNNDRATGGSLSKGAYEQWFYFPDGIEGPVFMRMQRWDPEQKNKLCAWLQNGQANYYFDSSNNRVHINNCRVCWSSLRVRRLPTDTAEFAEFLRRAEGEAKGFSKYTRDPNTGLLTSLVDYRFVNAPDFQTDYRYNTVGEEHFQYNWPAHVPIVDERDRMHARGWTYFRLSGQVDGQVVSGRGQIPFVYDACKEHPAWMRLNIGDEIEIIDCSNGACLRLAESTVLEAYPQGTFFQGLARPWMGMHTADIVRRDAAAQRVWFESKRARNETDAMVTLFYEDQQGRIDVIYTIDLENDLIKDIRFDTQGEAKGRLTFSYLQDIDQLANEFSEPAVSLSPQPPTQQPPGIQWLIHLAQGNLAE